jgi:alpha-L-fucosidase
MGDYQDMNDNGMPTGGLQEYWETPQTINGTWGYSKFDQQWKTPADVIHRMVEIVSKGGNYLLNIGPMADGAIPAPSVATLQGVGQWMQTNSDSIYGTTASPLPGQPWGLITVKDSLLYLHVFTWPGDGNLRIPGLQNHVLSAYPLLASSHKLPVAINHGTASITLPEKPAAPASDTVFVLQLDGPPKINPVVLTQGSDSPFNLDYASAVTSGRAVKRYNREGGFHIAKWMAPQDSATWHLLLSQAGAYHLRISYSAAKESKGAHYQVKVGSQTINASVEATGEGYAYKTFDLQAIRFDKVGPLTVQIAPTEQLNHNLMYLHSVDLVPDGPIMIE